MVWIKVLKGLHWPWYLIDFTHKGRREDGNETVQKEQVQNRNKTKQKSKQRRILKEK